MEHTTITTTTSTSSTNHVTRPVFSPYTDSGGDLDSPPLIHLVSVSHTIQRHLRQVRLELLEYWLSEEAEQTL